MKYVIRIILVVLLGCSINAAARDNAYGPWNIDISGTLNLETNSNVFFEESGPKSDTAWHIVPKLTFEYEQLDNVLFLADLELNSSRYSKYDEANFTETALTLEARPVHYGAYMVFAENYTLGQSYSPTGGLLRAAINELKIGGGYGGNHLDINVALNLERGTYSPSEYKFLNYSRNGLDIEVKYLHNSLYWLGGLGFGSLNYSDSAFNDGKYNEIMGGVGKEFSPKTNAEFSLTIYNQNHSGSGADDFRGVLFAFETQHKNFSGKGNIVLRIEKQVIPSTVLGSDFTQVTAIQLKGNGQFTQQFNGGFDLGIEFDNFGSRTDRVFTIGFSGVYKVRKWFDINFGFVSDSRTSDEADYSFRQRRIFIGATAAY